MAKGTKREKRGIFLNVPLSVLIIVCAFVVSGTIYLQQIISLGEPFLVSDIEVPPSAKATDDSGNYGTENWIIFKDKILGVQFQYPPIFGEPRIEFKDYQKNQPENFFGKAIEVFFEEPGGGIILAFGGHTPDYRAPDFRGFVGNQDILDGCPEALSYSQNGAVCAPVEFGGIRAILENQPLLVDNQLILGTKIYFNNNSESEFLGLEFYTALSDVNQKLYDLSINSKNSQAKIYGEALAQSRNIMEAKNLSEADIQQLRDLKKMLLTFKFIK